MKWIDLPPIWLLLCLGVAKYLPWTVPWGAAGLPGIVCLVAAALLVGLALWEFGRVRTTPIPHQMPSALITTGVFGFSRNPIYLADLLILLGFALIWGHVMGFVLLPVLWAILEFRFIRAEERRLDDAFPEAFRTYKASVRRWV